MGLWEKVTLSSFEPREAFALKNWKILDSFKHRRSSDWSLPSELGDLRNSLCIIACHFSYENEEGSGWTLLSLPELRENELLRVGMGIFWWFLCAETQASRCKVAGTERTAAACELALENFLLLALRAGRLWPSFMNPHLFIKAHILQNYPWPLQSCTLQSICKHWR